MSRYPQAQGKFIPPVGVVFIKPSQVPKLTNIWPIGHLYLHVESGIYFRFYKRDGENAISTDRGVFVMNTDRSYQLVYPGTSNQYPVKNINKGKLLDKFLQELPTLKGFK